MVPEATKHLHPLEVYATLLAGPAEWKREKLPACSIAKLDSHLQAKLEGSFASELNRMLGDWVKWDIPHLAQRRREALDAHERQRTEAEATARRAQPRRRPPHRRDRPDLAAYFEPPPKT